MNKPLNIEPRQLSELDYYAALHLPADREPDPQWPGHAEEIRAAEPECTAYRKYMERAREEGCHGLAGEGKREPKKAPKVPRDAREPAHLHVVLALLVFVVTCVTLLAGSMLHGLGWIAGKVAPYADAFLAELLRWIGGVL